MPTKSGARNIDMVHGARGNSCNAGFGVHITPSGSEIGVNMVARKRDSVRMTQGGSVRSKERPRVLGFFFPGLEMRDCISVSNKIR